MIREIPPTPLEIKSGSSDPTLDCARLLIERMNDTGDDVCCECSEDPDDDECLCWPCRARATLRKLGVDA